MTNRPLRPLAIIGVLAFGDYLLWNWSVGGNRDVLALVAGVTLIPLSIATVWLAALAVVHIFASLARRSRNAVTGAPAAARDSEGLAPGAATPAAGSPRAGARRPDSSASPPSRLAA